jgi:hypothetical protein
MTTHKSAQTPDWAPARESDSGNLQGVIGYVPASTLSLADNDTIQMVKIPLGAIVMDCILETGALDTNVLAAVGDLDDVNRYITAANVAAASLTRKNQTDKVGIPYRYTAEDTIDVKLTNGTPASTVAIRLDVFYICGVDETP